MHPYLLIEGVTYSSSDPFRGSEPPSEPPDTPTPAPAIPYLPSSPLIDSDTELLETPRATTATRATETPFNLSSDPLNIDFQPQSRIGNSTKNLRKRGPSSVIDNARIDKTPRPSTIPTSQAEYLILQARDLLLQAYSVTNSREQQTRLLDLVEVFREYTELGRIRHTSTILAI